MKTPHFEGPEVTEVEPLAFLFICMPRHGVVHLLPLVARLPIKVGQQDVAGDDSELERNAEPTGHGSSGKSLPYDSGNLRRTAVFEVAAETNDRVDNPTSGALLCPNSNEESG